VKKFSGGVQKKVSSTIAQNEKKTVKKKAKGSVGEPQEDSKAENSTQKYEREVSWRTELPRGKEGFRGSWPRSPRTRTLQEKNGGNSEVSSPKFREGKKEKIKGKVNNVLDNKIKNQKDKKAFDPWQKFYSQ